jgi:predicted dehydrogenase
VDIATPPRDHAPIACAAMQRGMNVLCEKPLAASLHEADMVLSEAHRCKRTFFPVHNYKFAPSMRAVRDIIDSGRIGAVNLVTLDTFRTQHARGVPEWLPDWRRIRGWAGGGIAMDHGAHTFYLVFDWLGGDPLSITAKMSSTGAYDTEDNFTCTVTFPSGVAMARLTWNAAVRKVIYTIHGDRGAIKLEDDDIEIGAAVDAGEYVGADARDAALCVRVIETAYASSRSGCVEMSLAPALHGLANAQK